MANDSASGGLIAPISTAPLYDTTWDGLLQAMVAGITGLPGNMCRPRWQAVPAKRPEIGVDWAAIGVMDSEDLGSSAQVAHDGTGTIVAPGDGVDDITVFERDTVMVSFYGPDAWENSNLLRTGLRVSTNRYALEAAGVGYQETGKRVMIGELINEQYYHRVDMPIILTRIVQSVYPVYNMLSATSLTRANRPGGQDIVTITSTAPPTGSFPID
jgi:hypothetical protein